jgi:hypothetical protein
MSFSSWVGSVWGLRGAEGSVIGQVRAVEGESLILSVVGLGEDPPEGVEILSSSAGRGGFARISLGSLLAHWDRMSGDLSRFLAVPHRDAA